MNTFVKKLPELTVALLLSACGAQNITTPEAPQDAGNPLSEAQQLSPQPSTGSPAILQVAVIGDSQSTGLYGQRLSELIRNAAQQRLSYFGAASSARIGSWVSGGFSPIPANAFFGCDARTDAASCVPANQPGRRTESITEIIRTHPYIDLYIFTLGDNHFYDPASVKSDLPRLVKPVLSAGAQCAFVTPTRGSGTFANKSNLILNIKNALNDVKVQTGKTCALIDSYQVGREVLRSEADVNLMLDSVAGDPMKLHPRGKGAQLWAERVFEALKALKLLTPL